MHSTHATDWQQQTTHGQHPHNQTSRKQPPTYDVTERTRHINRWTWRILFTWHLTLRMTTAEAVETSVTSTNINNLSQDYTNLDDHFPQTTKDSIIKYVIHSQYTTILPSTCMSYCISTTLIIYRTGVRRIQWNIGLKDISFRRVILYSIEFPKQRVKNTADNTKKILNTEVKQAEIFQAKQSLVPPLFTVSFWFPS